MSWLEQTVENESHQTLVNHFIYYAFIQIHRNNFQTYMFDYPNLGFWNLLNYLRHNVFTGDIY